LAAVKDPAFGERRSGPLALAASADDPLTSIEICAGAGGQALGLERAGYRHLALVENDGHCCETLRRRRTWRKAVCQVDIQDFRAARYRGRLTLLAGGVPCPPFSRAGRRLGPDDDRDLFPQALRLVGEARPEAVMLENVRGLLSSGFDSYRAALRDELEELGYRSQWKLLHASDFTVPQLRPRAILVAFRKRLGIGFSAEFPVRFEWPAKEREPKTVGQVLKREMARNGWEGAAEWAGRADDIAPTLVGGSKKHGGADLGPTQAKRRWAELGVDALVLGDEPPRPGWEGMPRLTVEMAALLQGFPRGWPFAGGKTAAYRQVGNAFPPPVAEAVGRQIAQALESARALMAGRAAAGRSAA
jgi:DNA (cytosine-5)-methyltransferase 1